MDDFEKKIPRKEIEDVEKYIKNLVTSLDENYLVTICGSYRRGLPESGDIDALITHPSFTSDETDKAKKKTMLADVVETLDDLIVDTIALGETKFMGACKKDGPVRRLDIRLTPHDQYYCSVLYFTGSDMFNKEMRQHALDKGFTLNEYSLRPIGMTGVPGEPVPISCERDVFDYINYPWREPSERCL